MRITMVCDFFDPRLSYQENLLARCYRESGHDLTVVTSTAETLDAYLSNRFSTDARTDTLANGTVLLRLPFAVDLVHRLRLLKGLSAALAASRPDFLFVHDINFNLVVAARYARTRGDCRLVTDCHTDYSNSTSNVLARLALHTISRRACFLAALPQLERVFAVTPQTVRFAHGEYGVPRAMLELLPLGTDVTRFRELRDAGAREVTRTELGVAASDVLLFTGGKIAPSKRLEMTLQAFARLQSDRVRLIVAGDGDSAGAKQYFRDLRFTFSSDRRIRFLGWTAESDVARLLVASDVAVFAASQSILWQHAIGAGLPLVIGDRRARAGEEQDVSYLGSRGNIVITDGTVDGMVGVLDELVRSDDWRAAMREGSLRTASEKLDIQRIAADTLRAPFGTDSRTLA